MNWEVIKNGTCATLLGVFTIGHIAAGSPLIIIGIFVVSTTGAVYATKEALKRMKW